MLSGSAWEPGKKEEEEVVDDWGRRRGGNAYDDQRGGEADAEEQGGAGVHVVLAATVALARAAWTVLRTTPGASVAAGLTGFFWGRRSSNSFSRRAWQDQRDAAQLAALAEDHIRAAEARGRQCDAKLREERALQAAVVARLEAQVAALKSALAEADVRAAVECKQLWDAKQAEVVALEQQIQAILQSEAPEKHAGASFAQLANRKDECDDDTWIDEE
jgi:hypothetical protein